MLQSTAYSTPGQVSLPTIHANGPYSNYHPFAHLSDFCMPMNLDQTAVYANFGAVYSHSYPSSFNIKTEQASSSSTRPNDLVSYTNLDENKENIGPGSMRSRSSSLTAKPEKETSESVNSIKDFKSEDDEQRYRERRNKNNQAAKQSRCKRREREKHLQDRVKALEQENDRLHQELHSIKQQHHDLIARLQSKPATFLPSLDQKPPADPNWRF